MYIIRELSSDCFHTFNIYLKRGDTFPATPIHIIPKTRITPKSHVKNNTH